MDLMSDVLSVLIADVAAAPGPAADTTVHLPGARDGRDPARAIKRGPRRVPREEIAAAQRDRLYDALVRTVAEHGYADASVSDICRAAGVTRPAFYEHFSGKQAAFLAAYEHGTGVMFRMMRQAYEAEREWSRATRAGLKVLLEVLASVPAFAVMAVVEVEAVGPAGRLARADLLGRFAEFFAAAPGLPPGIDRDGFIEAVVGGVNTAVYGQIAAGRVAELPALLPMLAHFVIAPFAGSAAAAAPRPAPGVKAAPPAVAPCVVTFLPPALPPYVRNQDSD
jgi:AcrR family transcriptional regulator